MQVTAPPAEETLRLLGCKPEFCDAAMKKMAARARTQIEQVSEPRGAWRILTAQEAQPLLNGTDIRRHLVGCTGCVLLAGTLGAGVDALLRRATAEDMAFAVVLDAAASVMAEALAETLEQTVRERVRQTGQFLTLRFSPGYGDYALSAQPILLRMIEAQRTIGLSVTESFILTPRKSVTAVCGLADHPVRGHRAGCDSCALRENCRYRKEGRTCETA